MPISAGVATAIMAGASTAGNITGGLLGARKNYKYTKRLQDAQNAYNTQMWNRTNEYNLPVNQVQRLKDAGFNPALLEGNGALNTPAQSVQGSSPSQFTGFNNLGNVGSDFINSYQALSASDLTSKQAQGQGIENSQKLLDLYVQTQTAADRIRQVHGSADQMENLAKKTFAEYEGQLTANTLSRETQDDVIKQASLRTRTMELENQFKQLDVDTYEKRFLLNCANSIADIQLKYKQGILAEKEAKAAIINACANAKNADTNAFNAQTNRMVGSAQAANFAASTEYQRGVNSSVKSHGYWYETKAADYKVKNKQIDTAASTALKTSGVELAKSVLTLGLAIGATSFLGIGKGKIIKGFAP